MKTPPNSFVSDIKYISPGSSELEDFFDDFDKVEDDLKDVYINKATPLYFSNWELREREDIHKKNLDIIRAYKDNRTIEINCAGEIIRVSTLLAPILSIINKYEMLTIKSSIFDKIDYCSITFSVNGYDKWSDQLLKNAIRKYNIDGKKDCYDYDLLKRLQSKDEERKLSIFNEGIRWEAKGDDFVVVWIFSKNDVEQIYSEIYHLLKEI